MTKRSQQQRQEATLDALGNRVRREILRLLVPGAKTVGSIAADLPVSRPAVSKHLRILERAELVRHEGRGTSNLFRLNPEGFAAARGWIESFWDEALPRFAALAEETATTSKDQS